jgi:poly-beta-hydroxyalkanoate depolymerase
MAEDGDEAQPRSMTLMAGPIVRVSARRKSTNWPPNGRLAGSSIGAGRWVYPGFLQLAAFIGMNLERHLRSFYEEYFAVMDLPAEFYLA